MASCNNAKQLRAKMSLLRFQKKKTSEPEEGKETCTDAQSPHNAQFNLWFRKSHSNVF